MRPTSSWQLRKYWNPSFLALPQNSGWSHFEEYLSAKTKPRDGVRYWTEYNGAPWLPWFGLSARLHSEALLAVLLAVRPTSTRETGPRASSQELASWRFASFMWRLGLTHPTPSDWILQSLIFIYISIALHLFLLGPTIRYLNKFPAL